MDCRYDSVLSFYAVSVGDQIRMAILYLSCLSARESHPRQTEQSRAGTGMGLPMKRHHEGAGLLTDAADVKLNQPLAPIRGLDA